MGDLFPGLKPSQNTSKEGLFPKLPKKRYAVR